MYDLVLKGKLLKGGKLIEGSIGVLDGKIVEISRRELKGEVTIKIQGKGVVLPGLIDTHVHLRDFEEKKKETVESGTKAALHGGITAVFDMPNTNPPVIDTETFEKRLKLLEKNAYSDYAAGFLLSGNCGEAKTANADFYKIFMGASTGGIYSTEFGEDYSCAPGFVSVHAEDGGLIKAFPDRPPLVEARAIEKALSWAERLKKPLNVCHVSTGDGLNSIISRGLPWVTFEVTPHHLFLGRKDYLKNPLLKVYPPLRDKEHQKALWEHFKEIPIIASDHAPHTLEDKENGAAGIPGLETEVALLLDAINRGLVTLQEVVEKMHDNPVRFFGIKEREFEVGGEATFTVVDLKKEWVVRADELYTKAGWSPWEGKRLRGKVTMTILRGEVVMEDDEIFGKPKGVRLNVSRGGSS